ncbi:MAG: oligosaccharide flippase family protein [Bacteroidales bacterium]|nr:oligosaccharide flippase family protein [Bacteroidales bacterium]
MSAVQKKLFSGIVWVLLLNILVKPFWILGIEVGVQNEVGNENYGFYFAVFNFAYIFNILLDLGLTNFNVRNTARHPLLTRKYLAGGLSIKMLLFVVYLIVTFVIGSIIGYGSAEFRLLFILCVNQFLSSLLLYLRSALEGLLLFKWDSVLSVLDRLIMIAICGMMLWGGLGYNVTITRFAIAQTFAYVITVLTAAIVLYRHDVIRQFYWKGTFFIAVLRKSLPYALLVLLMASYNRIDSVILMPLAGKEASGIYAGAFKMLDALTMLFYLVSVPLLPVYSRLTFRQDKTELFDTTQSIFPAVVSTAVAISITFSFLSSPLMAILYGENGAQYEHTFGTLIFALIPIGISYVFGTLLTAGGKLRVLNTLAVVALLLNVVLNLMLIPRYGTLGAACASLTSQSFMALAQIIVTKKIYKLPLRMLKLPPLLLYTAAIVALNVLFVVVDADWIFRLIFAAIAALCLMVVLKIIDIKKIKTIIQ